MKTAKELSKVKGVGSIETPENNPTLLHFLSDLELAAYKSKFKAFKYNLEGTELVIGEYTSKALYYQSVKHIRKLRCILQKPKQVVLNRDPGKRKFLLMPLEDHKLPTRLYHLLKGAGCRNMADIANKGEYQLRFIRGIGDKQITYLMNLFIDNGCGILFL